MFIIRKGCRVFPSRSERHRGRGVLLKLEVAKSASRTNGLFLFPLTPAFNPSFSQPAFQQPHLFAIQFSATHTRRMPVCARPSLSSSPHQHLQWDADAIF